MTLDPQITVEAPNGGETWPIGTTQTIEWTRQDLGGSAVDITLLRNGSQVEPIVEGTSDDDSYEWQIPDDLPAGGGYKIEVAASDGSVSDQSNSDFTLVGPELNVSPTTLSFSNGSGTKTFDIANDGGGTLDWSIDESASWLMVSPTSGSGPETVEVSVEENTDTDQRTATIDVTSEDGGSVTVSVEQSGRTLDPQITVEAPDGGETWQLGTTQTIEWTRQDLGGSAVDITLFRNGSSVEPIVEGASDGDSYEWAIPDDLPAGGGYRVEVAAASGDASDRSDSDFTLAEAGEPFITTWQTASPNEMITIPTKGGTSTTDYDFTIDWGDGSPPEPVTGDDPDPTHTYASAGTYTVKITGTFPHLFLDAQTGNGDSENAAKLQSVEQWGAISWESMDSAFEGANNMVLNATDTPNLANVSSTRQMFFEANAFNGDIGGWNVSGVVNMNQMFRDADNFNEDIGGWNVSNVVDMTLMFAAARTFNQDVGGWDVSSVTDMGSMFLQANAFNQDVGGWDVSSVTDMGGMFTFANAFNQDISGWDVSNVTNMAQMFAYADAFNQDIGGWDVSSVTDMSSMFRSATSFDQDLGDWIVSNLKTLEGPLGGFLEGGELSPANYDALLNGWEQLNLQNGLSFHAGASQYTSAAESARQSIISNDNWTINDGGLLENPQITVEAPNGGETWQLGATQTIEWTSQDLSGSAVDITLLRNGSQVEPIVEGASDGDSYEWQIPDDLAAGGGYRVEVAAANGDASDRSDSDFTLEEPPTLSVSPQSISFVSGGGAKTFDVSNTGGGTLSWSITGGTSWLSVAPSSGSGPATVEVTTQENTSTSTRSATITVDTDNAGTETVTVEQSGVTLNPQVTVVTPNGGEMWQLGTTQTIEWTSQDLGGSAVDITLLRNGSQVEPIVEGTSDDGSYGWEISTDLTAGSGYKIEVVASDGSPSDRSDGTFTLEEPPALGVSPQELTFSSGGEAKTFDVTNDGGGTLNWSISESVSWLSVDPSSGSGSATIEVTATENTTASMRSATITVDASASGAGTETVTVEQAGPEPVLSVSPNEIDAPVDGDFTAFQIENAGGGTMEWTVSSNKSWVLVPESERSGTNDEQIEILIGENTTNSARSATVTVDAGEAGTETITVNQPAPAPEPQITVEAPNGGEVWQLGTTQTIEWTSQDLGGSAVDITLLRNGSQVEPIVEGTSDDGSYEWAIPDDLTAGDGYRVEVVASDGSASDQSNSDFTLESAPRPDLVVTSLTFSPSNPTTDDAVTAEYKIENQGNADSPSFGYRLLYNGTEVDQTAAPPLVPGGSVTASYDLGTNPAGTIPITVEADPDDAIAESDETNNSLTEDLPVRPITTLTLGEPVEDLSGASESEQDFVLPESELSASGSSAPLAASKQQVTSKGATEDASTEAAASSVRMLAGPNQEQPTNRAGQQLPVIVRLQAEREEATSKSATVSKSTATSASTTTPDMLRFSISGGSGDADLYVRLGAPPTTDEYDCRPYLFGNDEACEFSDPSSGDWYVMIRGFEAYSSVTLLAEANDAPVVNQSIPNLTADDALLVGVDLPIVQFGDVFSDPDDDPLNLSVSSSDEGTVAASMDDESLILSPQSVGGPVEIEIEADDGLTTTSTTFEVEVDEIELNFPPTFESAGLAAGDGTIDLGNSVATDISLQGTSGSGLVRVSLFDTPPDNSSSSTAKAAGISEGNVSEYRWFMENTTNLSFGDATEIRFNVDEIEGSGIVDDEDPGQPGLFDDANSVSIYKRSQLGQGTFELVCAASDGCYDEQNNELVAAVSSFGEFVFASDTEPLPVELTSFDAAVNGEAVQLTWQTASETNNAGFEVQRRIASTTAFERVGFVEGAGTSSEPRSYQFDDADLPFDAEHATYRLKQVDLDGSFEYSPEVEVALGAPERFALHGNYPNPVRSRTTIRYELPQPSEVQLVVYDVLGQRVATLTAEQQAPGRKEVVFDTSGLASGTYFYRLEAGDHVATQSMTVVR